MKNKLVIIKSIVVILLAISYFGSVTCVANHFCKSGHLHHTITYFDNQWLLDYFWVSGCVTAIILSWVFNLRILKWISLSFALILYHRFFSGNIYLYGIFGIL